MRCISRTCMSFNYNTACLFSIKKLLLQSLNCSTFQMFSFSYRVRTVRIACAHRTFTVQFVISAPFALTIHYKAFTVCSLHYQHRFSVGPPFRLNSSSGIPKWKSHRKKYENKTDHVFLIPSAHSFNKVWMLFCLNWHQDHRRNVNKFIMNLFVQIFFINYSWNLVPSCSIFLTWQQIRSPNDYPNTLISNRKQCGDLRDFFLKSCVDKKSVTYNTEWNKGITQYKQNK